MVETEYRLDETVRATLDSNGAATITNIGPKQYNERWRIENNSITGTASATLKVFRGNDTGRLLDTTEHANNDSSDTVIPLKAGEVVSFAWSNGTAGAQMLAHIEGFRYVTGQRAY